MEMNTNREVEKILILEAKNNNKCARDTLFCMYQKDIEKAFMFSSSGKFPKNYNYKRNENGAYFREMSGEVFLWFCRAIDKFDDRKNMTFKSFFTYEIEKRSLDRTRLDTKISTREVTERNFGDKNYIDNAAYEAENTRDYDDACDRIMELFDKKSREYCYLKNFLEFANYSKNPSKDICESMHVSRQAISLYKKKILAKLRDCGYTKEELFN